MRQFGARDRGTRMLAEPGLNGAIDPVIVLDPGAGLDLGHAITTGLRRHHIGTDQQALMFESGFEDRPVGLYDHDAPGCGQRIEQVVCFDQDTVRLQRLRHGADRAPVAEGHGRLAADLLQLRTMLLQPEPLRDADRPAGAIWEVHKPWEASLRNVGIGSLHAASVNWRRGGARSSCCHLGRLGS